MSASSILGKSLSSFPFARFCGQLRGGFQVLFSVVPVGLQLAGVVNLNIFVYFVLFLYNFTKLM